MSTQWCFRRHSIVSSDRLARIRKASASFASGVLLANCLLGIFPTVVTSMEAYLHRYTHWADPEARAAANGHLFACAAILLFFLLAWLVDWAMHCLVSRCRGPSHQAEEADMRAGTTEEIPIIPEVEDSSNGSDSSDGSDLASVLLLTAALGLHSVLEGLAVGLSSTFTMHT